MPGTWQVVSKYSLYESMNNHFGSYLLLVILSLFLSNLGEFKWIHQILFPFIYSVSGNSKIYT